MCDTEEELIEAMKQFPRKDIYRMAKKVVTELDHEAKIMFSIGDRVKFKSKRGMYVTGTVDKINAKTISLRDCDDGGPGWRIQPGILINLEGA